MGKWKQTKTFKMKNLFHGTTKENYELIKKNGFAPEDMVWNCSSDSEVYFYDTDKTDYDEEDDEYKKDWCIGRAFESARLTAAVQGTLDSELIVVEVRIDQNTLETIGVVRT